MGNATAHHAMTIAGELALGSSSFPVIDPASGAPFARAPECSHADLERAMDAAELAFRSWKRDEADRRRALVAASNAIVANADELARLLVQEQGKPLPQARREVMGASIVFKGVAKLDLSEQTTRDDGKVRITVRRRPYGVVGAITPWNYPILIAVTKVAPALLAGNTVVLKPSPFTPLTTLALGALLREALPPGVLNVVSGGDELGRWISEHPAVKKVTFTGSVATGKKVAKSAAADLKRVTLELGGNDPAIVLGDVNPERIAKSLFWGAFMNSGQVCTAIKRVYVEERIFDDVVRAVSAIARSVKLGPGLEPEVELGPINNAPQHRRVSELVTDARACGARVHAGGGPIPGTAYFYEPTIVSDVGDDVRLVAEEQFGPALPFLPFSRLDDALERANATHFGLSASVWTADTARGTEIARELDCGTAWVNQHMALSPYAPFGGSKWSGIGYENGQWGLDGFCQLQVVNVSS
jgi:acyl-CoA reductase-like NAD-dependent aldehyde dehydrogenase